MHESDNASVQCRCRCGCAVVDGYRCGNKDGQLQVKLLHAHLGIAMHDTMMVKKSRWQNLQINTHKHIQNTDVNTWAQESVPMLH